MFSLISLVIIRILVFIYAALTIPFVILVVALNWYRCIKPKKRRSLPPKILDDQIYGKHSYIQIPNVKLHYVENGDKSKPLILFLHGFPDFWFSWRNQLTHFSKSYWTVAVDLRGYGDSEKPYGVSSYLMKHLVNDVKNLIEALGCKKCILVSHDWGAGIAWKFLLKHPDMIEKYIMINMHPPPFFSCLLRQYLRSWYMAFFQWPCLPEWFIQIGDLVYFEKLYGQSEQIIEAYKFMFGKPGAMTYPINYYRANVINTGRNEQPKKDNLPEGLLIYTENDEYIDYKNFINAKNKIKNLDTKFIESGGHFLHQTKPEQVNEAIDLFLHKSQ